MWQSIQTSLYAIFSTYLAPLLLIALLTWLLIWLVDRGSALFDVRVVHTTDDADRKARIRTLQRVVTTTIKAAIVVAAVLIALGTVGINIGPAIAAVGVVGLAISLGAQTLIKDVIAGATILLEDHYRVGDSIVVDDITGQVEAITLRRTNLRDGDGRLVIVPNGEVRIVSNETRNWSRSQVDLHFAYDADIKRAVTILSEAMQRAADDALVQPFLLKPPEVQGWSAFDNWSVTVRLRAEVAPGKQGDVARVLRQYALEAINAAGVAVESQNRPTTMASTPPAK